MSRCVTGKNDLETYCKANGCEGLLKYWDYEGNAPKVPSTTSYGTKEKVLWKCVKCNKPFPAQVYSRINSMGYCDECARKEMWKKRKKAQCNNNSLAITNPEIAEEWDYALNNGLTPQDVTKGEHREVYWKCHKEGHPSYLARISNRVYNGEGCPICGGRKILVGENDLATVYPFVAAQWDYEKNYPKTPQEVFPREGNSYWWICPICNESYPALVSNRTAGKNHDKCSRKGTSFPEQAIYFYIKKLFPDTINRDSSFGFELDIFIPSVKTAIEYDGLPYHSTEEAFIKDNKKDQLCVEHQVQLFRFRDPSLSDTQSAIRITCADNGKYDNSFDDSLKLLISFIYKESIPVDFVDTLRDYYTILSNTLISRAKRSILHTHPYVAACWHPTKNLPMTPDKVTSGMRFDAWWVCSECGKEYPAVVYSETRKLEHLCRDCVIKKRAKARSETAARKNNFASQFPELVEEIDLELNPGVDIHKLSAGSDQMIKWKCRKCGHVWPATVAHRTTDTGCPVCGREKTKKAAERAVINLDTGIVYNSLTLAAESCGGDKRGICDCCKHRREMAYGYHWGYKDPDDNRIRHDGMNIQNVETGEVFSSIRAAADQYGCDRSSISAALRGKTKTSQGYHWVWILKE